MAFAAGFWGTTVEVGPPLEPGDFVVVVTLPADDDAAPRVVVVLATALPDDDFFLVVVVTDFLPTAVVVVVVDFFLVADWAALGRKPNEVPVANNATVMSTVPKRRIEGRRNATDRSNQGKFMIPTIPDGRAVGLELASHC